MPVSDNGNEVLRKAARKAGPTAYYLDTHGAQNKSSFGDNISLAQEPVTKISAQYGILEKPIETFTATGGSVTEVDNMFTCKTGTSVGGYGVIRTRRPTIYREGQGVTARFTAIFDSQAPALSLQGAGLFNVQDSIFFGYRGTEFGIIYDRYGVQEARTFTATVSGSGNLTVTLNSVAYVIPITAGTVEHNLYEIEAWMNANQSVWNAEQRDSTVIFQNKNVGAAAGTYSISGTTFAGTFATISTGADKEQTTIAQDDWNGTPVPWLDPSKGNIYMQKIAYLGFGQFCFFIFNPNESEFELVHTIQNSNTLLKPNLSNRALKVGWVAASLGSTTDITVQGASAGTFIDGQSRVLGESISHGNSNPAVGTSFVGVISLRIKSSFNSKATLGRAVPIGLEISSDSSKETRFRLTKNATLGETDFSSHSDESIIAYDIGAHPYVDGEEVYEGQIGANGATKVDLSGHNIDVYLDEVITVFARVVSGAASDVTAAIIWKEDI